MNRLRQFWRWLSGAKTREEALFVLLNSSTPGWAFCLTDPDGGCDLCRRLRQEA